MGKRTTLADARHQSGARADALALFREAEAMQAKQQPEYPLLYSVQGFRYCDLLLGDVERMAWATSLGVQSCGYGHPGFNRRSTPSARSSSRQRSRSSGP